MRFIRSTLIVSLLLAGLAPLGHAVTNAPPVAFVENYETPYNTKLIVPVPGVLGNDIDPETNSLTAVLVSNPGHGSLLLRADGSFEYTPTTNYYGADSFAYRANDRTNNSNVATVSINIPTPPLAPVAGADSYTTPTDTALNITAPGVLANDTDVNNDALSAVLAAAPGHGDLILNANGSFTYTPTNGYIGADNFTYPASDGALTSAVAMVSLKINNVPVASGFTTNVDEDVTLIVAAPGVLEHVTDVDASPLTASKISGPSHGTVTLNPDGSFTYQPTTNYNGADSFTFKASDGTDDSNAATVTLTVNPVADAPVANPETYGTPLNIPLDVLPPGVLANDTDADGDALTAALVATTDTGTLTFNANGSFSYVPPTNFTGHTTFTYRANDGTNDSDVATVTIGVNINTPPIANPESYALGEDDSLDVPAGTGVLANDTDARHDPLTAAVATGPAHGVLDLDADGAFRYTPDDNFNGTDTFTYYANDGELDSLPGTVTLTVRAVSGAGDVDLYASSAAFSQNRAAANGDSLTFQGKINPRGAKANLTGATFQVNLNGTNLLPIVTLESNGSGNAAAGATSAQATFSSTTGAYSYRLSNANLAGPLGLTNTTNAGVTTLKTRLVITGADLDVPTVTGWLSVPVQTVMDRSSKGKFKYATNRILTGVFVCSKTQATQNKDNTFSISTSGFIEAEDPNPAGTGAVTPTGNIRVNVGGQVITLPPTSKVLEFDSKKHTFRFATNSLPTAVGIPLAGATNATTHLMPFVLTIPVAGGSNTYETIIELQRSSPTATKWQR